MKRAFQAGIWILVAALGIAGCDKAEQAQEHREEAKEKMAEAREKMDEAAKENAEATKDQAEADRTRVKEASGPAPQNPPLEPAVPTATPAEAGKP
jgi:hypothetical protein